MNCKQCGAPLNVVKGQNYFHCEYCGSYHFPDPNLDGVALLAEVSPHICPVCNLPLVSAVVKNVPIFSCPNCRGNLIAQAKMNPILRQVQPPEAYSEDPFEPPNPAEHTRIALCPTCRKPMAVYPYGGAGNVIIQGCDKCRLIWLDFGELAMILRAFQQQMYNRADYEAVNKQKEDEV